MNDAIDSICPSCGASTKCGGISNLLSKVLAMVMILKSTKSAVLRYVAVRRHSPLEAVVVAEEVAVEPVADHLHAWPCLPISTSRCCFHCHNASAYFVVTRDLLLDFVHRDSWYVFLSLLDSDLLIQLTDQEIF